MRRWLLVWLLWCPLVFADAAFDFDTTDDIHFGSGVTLDQLDAVTAAMWIDPDYTFGARMDLLNKRANDVDGWAFRLDPSGVGAWNLSVRVDYINGTVTDLVRTCNSISDLSGWLFVLMTWDGSSTAANVHLYYADANDATMTECSYSTTTNGNQDRASDIANNLIVGETAGGANDLSADIAWVQVYERVLAAWEFEEIRWKPCSIPTNLALCVPMWGADLLDISGNGNNGTNSGAASITDGPPVLISPGAT